MENLYKQNSHIIKKMSKKLSNITGFDYEELEAEGNLIFCECVQNFDPSRGEFEKYLSNTLYYKLYIYVKRENNFIYSTEAEENFPEFSVNDNFTSEKVDIEKLTNDSKHVIEIIMNPEIKFFTNTGRPSHCKTTIQKYLQNTLNWKRKRVLSCFKEIQTALNY